MASYTTYYYHDSSDAILARIRQLDAEIAAARARASGYKYTPYTYTSDLTYTPTTTTTYTPTSSSNTSNLWRHWFSLASEKHGHDWRWKSFFNRIMEYDDLHDYWYKVDDSWTKRVDALTSNISSLQKHMATGIEYTPEYVSDLKYDTYLYKDADYTPSSYYSSYYYYPSLTRKYDYTLTPSERFIKCARESDIYDEMLSEIDQMHSNLTSVYNGHQDVLNKVTRY